jgi:hypothetical protein
MDTFACLSPFAGEAAAYRTRWRWWELSVSRQHFSVLGDRPEAKNQFSRSINARVQNASLSAAVTHHYAAIYNTFTVQRHPIRRSLMRRFDGDATSAWNAATAAA